MKHDEMSPELKALLESTPVLSEQDVKELGDAVAALDADPEFIAGCIKDAFVNDILCAMEEQGLNKNQLAVKWGKTRQHVSQILDKETSKNFTIDTIVSLSMTLGLIPQRIELKKLDAEPAPVLMTLSRPALKVAESPGEPYRTKPAMAVKKTKARKSV
ncbi:MAG: hypothetical protein MUC65_07135 [Pontiellaceae bacterium]|jgi:predicted XRE-type DNA-binding protein|nr:hypothetical protein [Pontiellaceae bacterium]